MLWWVDCAVSMDDEPAPCEIPMEDSHEDAQSASSSASAPAWAQLEVNKTARGLSAFLSPPPSSSAMAVKKIGLDELIETGGLYLRALKQTSGGNAAKSYSAQVEPLLLQPLVPFARFQKPWWPEQVHRAFMELKAKVGSDSQWAAHIQSQLDEQNAKEDVFKSPRWVQGPRSTLPAAGKSSKRVSHRHKVMTEIESARKILEQETRAIEGEGPRLLLAVDQSGFSASIPMTIKAASRHDLQEHAQGWSLGRAVAGRIRPRYRTPIVQAHQPTPTSSEHEKKDAVPAPCVFLAITLGLNICRARSACACVCMLMCRCSFVRACM